MEVNVRKPNLEDVDESGVPRDFVAVRDYFNKALDEGKLEHIPRRAKITDEELKEKWVPSVETNITFVAEVEGKIVGSITVLNDPKSNDYEHAGERAVGSIGSSVDPEADFESVLTAMVKKVIEALKEKGSRAVWTFAEESPAKKIMENLGYTGEILENQERYSEIGLSGRVVSIELP